MDRKMTDKTAGVETDRREKDVLRTGCHKQAELVTYHVCYNCAGGR